MTEGQGEEIKWDGIGLFSGVDFWVVYGLNYGLFLWVVVGVDRPSAKPKGGGCGR